MQDYFYPFGMRLKVVKNKNNLYKKVSKNSSKISSEKVGDTRFWPKKRGLSRSADNRGADNRGMAVYNRGMTGNEINISIFVVCDREGVSYQKIYTESESAVLSRSYGISKTENYIQFN